MGVYSAKREYSTNKDLSNVKYTTKYKTEFVMSLVQKEGRREGLKTLCTPITRVDNKVFYSSLPTAANAEGNYKPEKLYPNADVAKTQILSDNKNQSGIYLWRNLINGKKYVGSSKDLRVRLRKYFDINYLERHNNMQISRALLKYGYSNFSIEIIEYCDPSERPSFFWFIKKKEGCLPLLRRGDAINKGEILFLPIKPRI
uniref:GIY-YIG domain-containing protein n=1 Tax=Morchella brunnea TaxID=1174671 RepID=A0A8K1MGI1_9PEZI|nr:hypothetical protein LK370_mgp047 [Morchella brunnea]UBU98583.1 hypothetical protein [Morchella brunnea]